MRNINLDIKAGETIGIIGGTGSSKSTLVQLIPRLYEATKGKVKVGGVDVKDYDLETLSFYGATKKCIVFWNYK